MILLEKSFLRHYFFAVVQTASKPHPTRGRTTLIARIARETTVGRVGRVGHCGHGGRNTDAPCPLHPAPCTLHYIGTFSFLYYSILFSS